MFNRQWGGQKLIHNLSKTSSFKFYELIPLWMSTFGFSIPLWLVILLIIGAILVGWKIVKFALKILLIIILLLLGIAALDYFNFLNIFIKIVSNFLQNVVR